LGIDWGRRKVVVLESDDWGLCAWSPDESAHRALADQPAFRGPSGLRYAGSTLESAADVKRLAAVLLEFRGGDGFAPVLQANTVMASPDYARLHAPDFSCNALPTLTHPQAPSRWARPGLWDAIAVAREAGVWWPELHGLHHLPETAWLSALRGGAADARRAFEQQSPVCEAVASSGEFDSSEPREVRRRNLEEAVRRFTALFGRAPDSFCPPDYRWDSEVEDDAARLGVHVLQGRAERPAPPLTRLTHLFARYRFPDFDGEKFYMPPRISFEPGAEEKVGKLGLAVVHRRVHNAWRRGHPALVSTHRANYVQLDASRSIAGLHWLRELLARLCREGAVFMTDAEVHSLLVRGWSMRAVGADRALVRSDGKPSEPVRFAAPAGVTKVGIREGSDAGAKVTLDRGMVEVRFGGGELLLEWQLA
jgi:hypothetical protein